MASVLSTTSLCHSTAPPSPASTGRYERLAGINVYVTGPASSRKAIIDVASAFTPNPTSSADSLSSSHDALVIVPDLHNAPSDVSQLGDYLSEIRKPDMAENFEFMSAVSVESQRLWPAVEAWGVYGLGAEEKKEDVQIFYNPLAVLLYIQLTVAAMAKKQ